MTNALVLYMQEVTPFLSIELQKIKRQYHATLEKLAEKTITLFSEEK